MTAEAERSLPQALGRRFGNARLERAEPGSEFAHWISRAVSSLDEPGRSPELPLDIIGTAFQARVWEALRRIPAGETCSYADVAAQIGRPAAARAVARACGDNPLAVVVPCHRVVGRDGSLRGYRWGIERKRALLARERRSG